MTDLFNFIELCKENVGGFFSIDFEYVNYSNGDKKMEWKLISKLGNFSASTLDELSSKLTEEIFRTN